MSFNIFLLMFQIETTRTSTTLTIKQAFPEDSGLITCRLKNRLGMTECSAELYVQGKWNFNWSYCLPYNKLKSCIAFSKTVLHIDQSRCLLISSVDESCQVFKVGSYESNAIAIRTERLKNTRRIYQIFNDGK